MRRASGTARACGFCLPTVRFAVRRTRFLPLAARRRPPAASRLLCGRYRAGTAVDLAGFSDGGVAKRRAAGGVRRCCARRTAQAFPLRSRLRWRGAKRCPVAAVAFLSCAVSHRRSSWHHLPPVRRVRFSYAHTTPYHIFSVLLALLCAAVPFPRRVELPGALSPLLDAWKVRT
jgi:hypothetical protein